MTKRRAVHKHDLRQLGWKALVAELGVANATRLIMELSASAEDYTKLRKKVFAHQTLDELYAEIKALEAHPRSRQ